MRRRSWAVASVTVLVVVLGLVALRPSGTQVTAYFASATGLYKGDPVKVMGVVVGKVTSVEPDGDRVRVRLRVDSQPIPLRAGAAIVAPSLVSERFVQLAPAYTHGARMANGGVIPVSRTAIPVSFDEVKHELTDLATALGPAAGDGAKAGSLDEAIRTLDANLSPDAATRFRDSLVQMRGATASLAAGGDDLFSTLHNLDTFVENLAVNDRAARQLTVGLAGFSGALDVDKRQLGSAIAGLDEALKVVRRFVRDNGDVLHTGVGSLEQVARTLASRSNELAGFLHAVPTAVDNLYNMIENHAITARVTLSDLHDLSQLLCGSLLGVGGTVADCRSAIAPLLETLGLRPRQAGVVTSDPGTSGTSGPALTTLPQSGLPLLDGLLASLTGGPQ